MATVAPAPSPAVRAAAGPRLFSVWYRSLRDVRGRIIGFTYLFAAVAFIQPIGYRRTYPTAADRLAFAHSFSHNKAVVLFYGRAYDLLSVGGYAAWRVGGFLAIFAGVFGLMLAVRLVRGNEESGQTELVLATLVSRGLEAGAVIAAMATAIGVIWLATTLGLVLGALPAGPSAYLALSVITVAAVFAAVGMLISQLASSRRLALELSGGVFMAFFLIRVIADTSTNLGWLDWATPLGWSELMRPFTGARPAVLILPAAATFLLIAVAARLQAGRDIGTGPLGGRDTTSPHLGLLASPTQQALRSERSTLLAWLAGLGLFGLVVGVVSRSVSSAGIPRKLSDELSRLGYGEILHPVGYISFTSIFLVFVISLFASSQLAAARHEEAEGRLETVLSRPVSRSRWLAGRLLLAAGCAAVLALGNALFVWLGAISQGVSVSAWRMLEMAANCLPTAVLFLGLGALVYGLLPRATAGAAYGLVTVAFVWQLFGSLLGAPHWLVDATPFAHLGLAPAHALQPGPAGVMLVIGLVAGALGVVLFGGRDLVVDG